MQEMEVGRNRIISIAITLTINVIIISVYFRSVTVFIVVSLVSTIVNASRRPLPLGRGLRGGGRGKRFPKRKEGTADGFGHAATIGHYRI